MSTPAISFTASNFVLERLLDTANDGFNQLILETTATYGVTPFQLSDSGNAPNLLVGRFDLPSLIKSGFQPNYPLCIMSVAKSDTIGRNSLQVTPSTFSGSIIVSLDFYVVTDCGSVPADGQSVYQAVEDAVVGAFSTDVSYALMPQGLTFNDEALVEQGRMEFGPLSSSGDPVWCQMIACTLVFRRVA